jgi:hypothetical protein
MVVAKFLLLACSALGQLPEGNGTIAGTVVNRTSGKDVPCQATVVLFVWAEGQFVPIRETQSDQRGEFRFDGLPVGDAYRFRPGANHHEIHYPGSRVVLDAANPSARVRLAVHDAVAGPNPLVLRNYEITLVPEPGALRVTESMVIDNPSNTCYVGKAAREGEEPVTLRMAIPADFERATFQEEFFGRRFSVVNDKVVTGIPWPPGRRELKFTYVLRNAHAHRIWERPLDLPCSDLRLRVRTDKPEEIACDLEAAASDRAGELIFRSEGRVLPAGHVLQVGMGHLPVPWMTYARWTAAGLLACLVAAAGAVAFRRRGRKARAERGERQEERSVGGPAFRRKKSAKAGTKRP